MQNALHSQTYHQDSSASIRLGLLSFAVSVMRIMMTSRPSFARPLYFFFLSLAIDGSASLTQSNEELLY